MSTVVSVHNLRKQFGKITAVNGISFDIQEGEIFGLLGPNGAGKTTTIHMLLDVIEPDAGEIRVFGETFLRGRESIIQRMNFSSSYLSLPWNLSVEENLMLFAKLFSVRNPKERMSELLTLFNLAELRKTMSGKLSSGERSRLLLAKAMVNRPRLLLLDEPTASMDPDFADRVRTILRALAKEERTTILYTSHNMSEIEDMCDRIAFLHHGKILAIDAPEKIIAQYGKEKLEDVFIHIARNKEEAL